MRAPGTRKHCSRHPFLADARPRSQRQQQRAPRRRRVRLLGHSVQQPGHVQEQPCVEHACASCRLLVSSSHILSFSPQYGGALFVNQSLAWVLNSALASNTANVRLRIRGGGRVSLAHSAPHRSHPAAVWRGHLRGVERDERVPLHHRDKQRPHGAPGGGETIRKTLGWRAGVHYAAQAGGGVSLYTATLLSGAASISKNSAPVRA